MPGVGSRKEISGLDRRSQCIEGAKCWQVVQKIGCHGEELVGRKCQGWKVSSVWEMCKALEGGVECCEKVPGLGKMCPGDRRGCQARREGARV